VVLFRALEMNQQKGCRIKKGRQIDKNLKNHSNLTARRERGNAHHKGGDSIKKLRCMGSQEVVDLKKV